MQALWSPYVSNILSGQAGACASCDSWLASLYSTPPASTLRAGAVESATFVVPPGYGPAQEVFVLVDGVLSANASYTYDAPVIANLAPDRERAAPRGSRTCPRPRTRLSPCPVQA